MKKSIQLALLLLISILFTNCTGDCPECPISTELVNPMTDMAGYLDGNLGALFTTSKDKTAVLDALNAEALEDGNYQIPIEGILDEPFTMCFSIYEVDNPYGYMNFDPYNACFEDILLSLESSLDDIIEGDWEDLDNDIILATGAALGQLEFNINDDNDERIGNGKKEDAKKANDNLKEVKKETKKDAKEAAEKIKEKLEQNDKDGAKEEKKKLTYKLKEKWTLKLKFDYDKPWCDSELYPYYKGSFYCIPEVPELLKTFIKQGIRYKVFKDADCNTVENPTFTFPCTEDIHLDSIRIRPRTYSKSDPQPSKSCIKGTSFCVEQEVIISIQKIYSDKDCVSLIDLNYTKGYSCK